MSRPTEQLRANLAPTLTQTDPVTGAEFSVPNPDYGLVVPQQNMAMAARIVFARFEGEFPDPAAAEKRLHTVAHKVLVDKRFVRDYARAVARGETPEHLDGEHARLIALHEALFDEVDALLS